jgi:hypothetical protein
VVLVEVCEKGLVLGLCKLASRLSEPGDELTAVDLLVAVEAVELSEGSSETPDGPSTSGFELCAHFVKSLYYVCHFAKNNCNFALPLTDT